MEAYQIAILAVSCTVLALIALWFFLIAPRPRRKATAPFLRPYAHRGLWDGQIPENSLAAFRKAAEQGFAIELDVQLSRDGEVMVFHDYTLTRMCGREVELSALTAAELTATPLLGTAECIPTLRQVLAAVEGRVPVLIELKGESGSTALCPKLSALLADYSGQWCVESFNPLLLRWWKKHRPDVVRGLLSTDLIKEKRQGSRVLNLALSALLLTFLCRPDFHAYDYRYPRRLGLWMSLRLGAAPVVFTVRDAVTYHRYLDARIPPIFDGFLPDQAK